MFAALSWGRTDWGWLFSEPAREVRGQEPLSGALYACPRPSAAAQGLRSAFQVGSTTGLKSCSGSRGPCSVSIDVS